MTTETKCKDCPFKHGCYATTLVQPNDVLLAPCGKTYGLANPRTAFWACPAEEWEKVKGTLRTPEKIEWCICR